MPRSNLPPTPGPSGDIAGRESPPTSTSDKTFNLPSPAMGQVRKGAPATSPKPIQPANGPNFSLPPPPTRSRTIIQMKPRPSQPEVVEKRPTSSGSKGSAKKASSSASAQGTTKKQPSSTSAAGKKIARKTAHSVIERRRRSKMNEEFAVLKAMIPACTDQEMHKLAILQASIDYLRYLESCVKELKAANKSLSTPLLQAQPPRSLSSASIPHLRGDHQSENEDDDEEEVDADDLKDVTMEDASSASGTPALSAQTNTPASAYTSPHSLTTSPALEAPLRSHPSIYTSLTSLPSPAFEPQNRPQGSPKGSRDRTYSNSYSHTSSNSILPLSTSTSPTILPNQGKEHDDHEATAALLMLNQDRRGPKTSVTAKGARGMSVKDLLSC